MNKKRCCLGVFLLACLIIMCMFCEKEVQAAENVFYDEGDCKIAAEPTSIPKETRGKENEVYVVLVATEEVERASNMRSSGYIEVEKTFVYELRRRISPLLTEVMATLRMEYLIYDYGDKVHLKSRGHYSTAKISGITTEINYGYIINTDGSRSYTSGDRLKITDEYGSIFIYDTDAEFTPTGHTINCFRIN